MFSNLWFLPKAIQFNFLGSLISGVTGFLGSNPWVGNVLGSVGSAFLSQKSADKQMSFQANQSNTAYQRAMADMKAAGLNPILAAKLGGASTPSGAMANIPDFGSTMASATSAQATQKQAEVAEKRQEQDKDKIEQEIKNLKTVRHLNTNQIAKVTAEIQGLYVNMANIKARTTGQNQVNEIRSVLTDFVKGSNMADHAEKAGVTTETYYEVVKTILPVIGRLLGIAAHEIINEKYPFSGE
jgi:hypothetical protein